MEKLLTASIYISNLKYTKGLMQLQQPAQTSRSDFGFFGPLGVKEVNIGIFF